MIMKRVLLIICIVLLAGKVSAQDFASRFLEKHLPDTNLTCVTISPKMMEKVMNLEVDGEQDMMEMISKLKSMRMVTTEVNGQKYYNEALKVLEKNSGRFEPYLSFEDKSENYQIMIRKKKNAIIELVMLMREADNFTVINFTGNMSQDFIARLAKSMEPKNS
ncbi:hypothetical protein BSYN_24120 [Bacteroides sedimenti]|uniref:DUF4252 domain-containing protein n=2 Tax=Bacteroides sedimenti TaxID=2136147 RepID=A0ABM8IDV3_9BACE